jgi:hypothetical protein
MRLLERINAKTVGRIINTFREKDQDDVQSSLTYLES